MKQLHWLALLGATVLLHSCGGGSKPTTPNATDTTQHVAAPAPAPTASPAPAAHDASSRVVIPMKKVGAITKKTNRKQLAEIYGDANVKDEEVYVAEGQGLPGTVLFGDTPDRLIILWDDDTKKESISLVMMTAENSTWRTDSGIGFGTTMEAVEKINAKPFKFSGFGWDYGGAITDYQGGSIPAGFSITFSGEVPEKFLGDSEFFTDKVKGLDKTKVSVVSMTTGLE